MTVMTDLYMRASRAIKEKDMSKIAECLKELSKIPAFIHHTNIASLIEGWARKTTIGDIETKILMELFEGCIDIPPDSAGWTKILTGKTTSRLEGAIKEGDMSETANCFRELSKLSAPVSIPTDITVKLADFLDPARPSIKSGPKSLKNVRRNFIISERYRQLCQNRGLARAMIHADKKEFELAKPYDFLKDGMKNFPGWKYPKRVRDRKALPYPKKGVIKGYICNRYKFDERTLETILAEAKKITIQLDYVTYCANEGCTHLEAERVICERYKITKEAFDKIIGPEGSFDPSKLAAL